MAGRTMPKRMWPVYAEAINTVIGARVSDREATSLSALLDQLLDRTTECTPAGGQVRM